jgi:hypothetical protein
MRFIEIGIIAALIAGNIPTQALAADPEDQSAEMVQQQSKPLASSDQNVIVAQDTSGGATSSGAVTPGEPAPALQGPAPEPLTPAGPAGGEAAAALSDTALLAIGAGAVIAGIVVIAVAGGGGSSHGSTTTTSAK